MRDSRRLKVSAKKRQAQDKRREKIIEDIKFQCKLHSKRKEANVKRSMLAPDDTHCIWNFPLFKNTNVNDRYVTARKQRLCYGCLAKGHVIKDCKVKACAINGCTKSYTQKIKWMSAITLSK